ncbi:MAG: anti-sigma factor [Chitinophagaceae bacterium]
MNVQAYILSGIVESYVLGLASAEEQAEFEHMASRHPEVLQARLAFEIALEQQSKTHAILPPESLREEIRLRLFPAGQSGAITTQPATIKDLGDSHSAPVRRMNFWKYVAAASVVLLIGSVIWNITMITTTRDLGNEIKNRDLRITAIKQELDTTIKNLALVTNRPDLRMAVMKGLEIAPTAFATVYWDTTSHDVYLAAQNLPVPASDKQYQLWAIFKGKPVDLGVFDLKQDKLLIRAKNAQGAEAFAITLEKKGGSSQPKGAMYVMGKL